MTIIKIKFTRLGGHYHCRLFTARGVSYTFAKCGELVFSEEEFPEVRRLWITTIFEEE